MKHQRPLSLAALLVAAATVAGFSSAATFDMDAAEGGAGGLTYTGSARSHGMDCATCHQGGADVIEAFVDTPASDLFVAGYEPGAVYQIEVWIAQEARGLDRQGGCTPGAQGCNRNAFVADILDAHGDPAGVLCPDTVDIVDGVCTAESGKQTSLAAAGTAVVGTSFQIEDLGAGQAAVTGRTRWSFQWQAPAAAVSDLSLHYGVVDGDGGTTLDPGYADYRGDATFIGVEQVWPAANGGPDRAVHFAGCAATPPGAAASLPASPSPAPWWPALLAVVLPFIVLTRRPRTTARIGVLALAMLALPHARAHAADTSCDIITGASCNWNEGCDCDHDGYVRGSGKAKKYCHWADCPLDANDSDPSVLGKVSQYNADGDGYTTKHDCDDNDACIDDRCIDICPAEPPPPDNPPPDNPPPDNPPPDNPPPDNPPVIADAGAGDTGGTDAGYPGSPPLDVGPTSFGDAGFLGSGQLDRHPPPTGCSGSPTVTSADPLGSLAAIVAVLLLFALHRRRAVILLVVAVLLATLPSCALVKPWERGVLAKDPMIFGSNAGEVALEQHCVQYREGAAGGFGGGGGGCGCN